MRQLALLVCLLALGLSLSAQKALNFWKPVSEQTIEVPENAVRSLRPVRYHTFRLDYPAMTSALHQAPMEFTAAARQQPLLLELPTADGDMRLFQVWESPIMEPELSAKYPEIRTYAGVAADGSGTIVRLGVGHLGFHAFVFGTDGSSQSVRTYVDGQKADYITYRLSDLPMDEALANGNARCGVEDHAFDAETMEKLLENGPAASDRGGALVDLKTYRIAIAARGEYSEFYGFHVPTILSAINTALNYIVTIQERDYGVRLILIANNDQIIFLDPATDPYSGNTVGDWMNQNPTAINSVIGSTSYDVGHVFSRYITGNQVGVVSGRICNQIGKARGASSAQNTNTEYFYRVAAHEFGHQASISHSWSNCPGSEPQLAAGTAYEPGSGSTIMSYAGSCSNNNNIQNDGDSYYHIASILQAKNFVWQDEGNTCGGVVPTSNNEPTVSIVSPKNASIPVGTPFRLTASGSDPDGNALSYCWEQYDLGSSTQLGMPTGTAPMFRSFLPTAQPTRFFPRMETIALNQSDVAEVVPQYARGLTFRVTVRDGNAGQDWEEIKLTVSTQAGPFSVIYPNANGITWTRGEDRVVEWDVANTDRAPVNSKLVNIKMSLDGGFSYPITLATGIPNNGRACIRVPNNTTNLARIMVESEDNVFFDISNSNFRVEAPAQPSFSLCASNVADTICLPTQFSSIFNSTAISGFAGSLDLSATGLPPGVTASFTPNPAPLGTDVTMTLNMPANQPEGTFNLTISATSGTTTKTFVKVVSIFNNDISGLSLKSPTNGAVGQNRAPALRWNATPNANTYEIQLASSPTFGAGTIIAELSGISVDSFQVPLLLEKGTVYYWQFRAQNECGPSAWLGPFVFSTLVDVCATFAATDLPKNIPATISTIDSKINVPASAIISDVNVKKVEGSHTFFRDLELRLISPTGTDVQLLFQKCGGYNGTFSFGFDDTSPDVFDCPPSKTGKILKPAQPLNAFINQNASGQWTLRAKDNFISSGGTLTAVELEFCSSSSLNPPILINNNTLVLQPGTNAAVATTLLKTTDSNNTDDQLVYTLMSKPLHGQLQLNWAGEIPVGTQFTQTQLNNGDLRYFHYGTNALPDKFCFSVTDGEGGLIYDCFNVQPLPLGTDEARSLDFVLTPNPATETVRLAFGENLRSDARVRIFDAAGSLVQALHFAAGDSMLSLNVSGLPEGMYVISVDTAEGSGVRKLVVR
ncbi:MAG: reprolysin-like metallopeptidase [Saprospiraceae bacterium]